MSWLSTDGRRGSENGWFGDGGVGVGIIISLAENDLLALASSRLVPPLFEPELLQWAMRSFALQQFIYQFLVFNWLTGCLSSVEEVRVSTWPPARNLRAIPVPAAHTQKRAELQRGRAHVSAGPNVFG